MDHFENFTNSLSDEQLGIFYRKLKNPDFDDIMMDNLNMEQYKLMKKARGTIESMRGRPIESTIISERENAESSETEANPFEEFSNCLSDEQKGIFYAQLLNADFWDIMMDNLTIGQYELMNKARETIESMRGGPVQAESIETRESEIHDRENEVETSLNAIALSSHDSEPIPVPEPPVVEPVKSQSNPPTPLSVPESITVEPLAITSDDVTKRPRLPNFEVPLPDGVHSSEHYSDYSTEARGTIAGLRVPTKIRGEESLIKKSDEVHYPESIRPDSSEVSLMAQFPAVKQGKNTKNEYQPNTSGARPTKFREAPVDLPQPQRTISLLNAIASSHIVEPTPAPEPIPEPPMEVPAVNVVPVNPPNKPPAPTPPVPEPDNDNQLDNPSFLQDSHRAGPARKQSLRDIIHRFHGPLPPKPLRHNPSHYRPRENENVQSPRTTKGKKNRNMMNSTSNNQDSLSGRLLRNGTWSSRIPPTRYTSLARAIVQSIPGLEGYEPEVEHVIGQVVLNAKDHGPSNQILVVDTAKPVVMPIADYKQEQLWAQDADTNQVNLNSQLNESRWKLMNLWKDFDDLRALNYQLNKDIDTINTQESECFNQLDKLNTINQALQMKVDQQNRQIEEMERELANLRTCESVDRDNLRFCH